MTAAFLCHNQCLSFELDLNIFALDVMMFQQKAIMID